MPDRSPRTVLDSALRRSRNALAALRGAPPASVAGPAATATTTPPGWWDLLPFTTHRIELAPGVWSADAGVVALDDVRLDLVLEASGGSVAGKRAVDLGCLEGGFTLAFAIHGAAAAVGIEARAISVQRCELARDLIGAANAEFVCGDIKDELGGRERFDVVFAAGILYHVGDPAALLVSMRGSCADSGFALIDTHVADEAAATHGCSPLMTRDFGGRSYRGRMFGEYPADLDASGREELLWAAWSDDAAFWPVESDLVEMIGHAGFASVEKVELADTERRSRWGVDQLNRVVYIARA